MVFSKLVRMRIQKRHLNLRMIRPRKGRCRHVSGYYLDI